MHLHYNNNDYPDNEPMVIKVDLPNSSLDFLYWEYDLSYFYPKDELRLLIKLKTKEDANFYVFSDELVLVVDEKESERLLPDYHRVEIDCKSL